MGLAAFEEDGRRRRLTMCFGEKFLARQREVEHVRRGAILSYHLQHLGGHIREQWISGVCRLFNG
jgi:hypothetical protein